MTAAVAAMLVSMLLPVDEHTWPSLIAQQRGRVVLVSFWATWCAPCREEMPRLVRLAKLHGAGGLRLITVCADDPGGQSAAIDELRRWRVPEPAYIRNSASDDSFINAVDRGWSGALPALFLYDHRGKLTRSFAAGTPVTEIERAVKQAIVSK